MILCSKRSYLQNSYSQVHNFWFILTCVRSKYLNPTIILQIWKPYEAASMGLTWYISDTPYPPIGESSVSVSCEKSCEKGVRKLQESCDIIYCVEEPDYIKDNEISFLLNQVVFPTFKKRVYLFFSSSTLGALS